MAKHIKRKKNTNILLILIIIMLIILILCLRNKILSKGDNSEEQIKIPKIELPKEESERIKKVKELEQENEDIVGYLEIEGTNINYPVLQGEDNDYYMTHTYKKEYSKDGSIFLDKDYDWSKPSTNLLIYGHNNLNGNMFCDLEKYKEESFYKEHSIIQFTTDQEDETYEIIAVFLSRVYYKSETNVFRYYYFIDASTKEEFEEYVNSSKKAALYDTGKIAEYGDKLLTLSTCSYHTEDGRLAVVAKKIK